MFSFLDKPVSESIELIETKQRCPHSSYPLSQGIVFDVEDFGVVLSAGIACPKHNWSFDLFTGLSDRSSYELTVWEVQLREVSGSSRASASPEVASDEPKETEKEVWVRRKLRMG